MWAPEPVWTFWRSEKSLAPTGIRTPDRPARSLVATPSTLLHQQIPLLKTYFGRPKHVRSLIRFLSVWYFIVIQFVHKGPGQRSRYSDLLRPGRSGDRISVGERFSAPIQTGPGAHPASCTMCTGSLSRV